MRLLVLTLSFFFSAPLLADGGASPAAAAAAAKPQCPSSPGLDTDGMPLCPDVVTTDSAWMVWQCGYDLVKSWHVPSSAESQASHDLINAWYAERSAGKSAATTQKIMAAVATMGGQVCRVTGADQYLVVWAAKSEYSGGNLLLRESTNVTNMVLVAPHSDSDGYYAAFPQSVKGTHYLAAVGEGHHRGNVAQGKDSDFVHHTPNLAYTMLEDVLAAQPHQYYMLHLHGDQASTKFLMRPTDNSPWSNAYIKAVEAVTRVTSYAGLNAYFVTDNLPFKAQVKSEMPAGIWMNNHDSMARIIAELEKSAFLWPSPHMARAFVTPGKPTASPEPWAPPQQPFVGKHTVMCVAIQYTSGPSANVDQCLQIAKTDADVWSRNSRGKLKLTPSAQILKWNGPADKPNAEAAIALMKKTFTADIYLVPNLWYKSSSFTGDHVCFLTGYANFRHESGHALSVKGHFGLDHVGAYVPQNCTPGSAGCTYDLSKDRTNQIMSDMVGAYLEASQYYWLGWYEPSEWAVYSAPQTFELAKLSTLDGKSLKTVFIPPSLLNGKTGFVTYPIVCNGTAPCGGFYYENGNGAGSEQVFRFSAGKDYIDPKSGLHLSVVGGDANRATIKISFGP